MYSAGVRRARPGFAQAGWATLVVVVLAGLSPGHVAFAAPASLAPPSGQVIRIPNREPLKLDPGLNCCTADVHASMSLFDPLVAFDADRVVPLAARGWEISKDGLTYTFHLRPGMQWSDGHPVTASDFEYAWKRVADPALASDYASAVYIIKGAEAYNKGRTKTPDGIAVTAVDPLTLRVTLAEPAAYFLRLVSTWTYMPVPRWQIETYGSKWVEAGHLVSNGPFMLQAWAHDQQMVLVANPRYYGPKPTLQRIIFVETDDPIRTSVPAFENNELDVSDIVGPADLDRLRKDQPTALKKFPWSGTAMMFNDTMNPNSPLRNVKVRQALYLAIDYNAVAHNVLRDVFDPGPTIMPAGILGRLTTPALTGGVERARQLLAEAGYPRGQGFPGFTLVWGQQVPFDLVAQALSQTWRDELNVAVTLRRMERKEFNAAQTAWRTQHYDAYIDQWGTDYEDPFNWDNTLFDSEADYFHTRWVNGRFDTLVRRAAGEANTGKRRQMYEQANTILETELPAIPLYRFAKWQLVKPYVEGFLLPGHAASDWFWLFRKNVKILEH